MARGDIVLFKSSGKWYERAIVMATRGPYVHVAIMTGDYQVIAAGFHGIGYSAFLYDPKVHTVISIAPKYATATGVETGLKWAISQAGKPYGWLDILYQGVKFLFPNNPFEVTEDGHYDCSDYATRYLQQAGVVLPPEFSNPYQNTPNDLYRLFLCGGMNVTQNT